MHFKTKNNRIFKSKEQETYKTFIIYCHLRNWVDKDNGGVLQLSLVT